MKHARLLITALFIVLLPLSWYKMYTDSSADEKLYQSYLANARNKASLQIIKEATQSYQAALAMYDSSEIELEFAQMFYDNKRYDSFAAICNDVVSKYPYEITAYERLAQYYYQYASYKDVLAIRDTVNRRKLDSKIINDLCQSIKYEYTFCGSYDINDISNFYFGFARIKDKSDKIGYLSEAGQRIISCGYTKGSIMGRYGLLGISLDNGESYIIDSLNDKVSCDPQKRNITYIGALSDSYFPVILGGTYYVSDFSYNLSEDHYDYIGGFTNGLAPAKHGTEWFFINSSGQRISDKTYEDIKLDESELAFGVSRAFVKVKDHYIMIGTDENQIGTVMFEDAVNFVQGNQPASVKIDGKWGFINESGEIILEPQFENARPFSNGLAGVMGADGWNYIDLSGKVVIPGPFLEVREFSPSGTAFVKMGEEWRLIGLYDNSVK